MQKNKALCILILHLLLFTLQLQSEGFLAGTLVKTSSGHSCIEQLNDNDTIISYNHQNTATETPITLTTTLTYDYCIKITIADSEIYCAPDQKFYSYNQKQWVTAEQLTATDFLMDDNGHSIAIDRIEAFQKEYTFYALSLKTNHTFCVSQHNIVVHNIIMIVPFFSAITPVIVPVVKTCLMAGVSLIGAHFATKFRQKNHVSPVNNVSSSNNNGGSWYDPNDPNNDKNKKNNDHPHGIYKDTPYHHPQCNGYKNPCPKDGQKCLDNSLEITKTQRISFENNMFVVLRQTCPGEFHGYISEWCNLNKTARRFLIKNGFTTKNGKIVKEMIRKVWQ